ncbi:MAG: carboxypeptidase-like regulatory domain-containing protein, partial [Myxococcota bacterium]|nr:carboxypeptidase-like regulatory domain-containing protein [Myxococcota bacterium]
MSVALGLFLLIGTTQAGVVSGTVTDNEGEAVYGVVVLAVDAGYQYAYDYTGPSGRFEIEGLWPGEFRLWALPPEDS